MTNHLVCLTLNVDFLYASFSFLVQIPQIPKSQPESGSQTTPVELASSIAGLSLCEWLKKSRRIEWFSPTPMPILAIFTPVNTSLLPMPTGVLPSSPVSVSFLC